MTAHRNYLIDIDNRSLEVRLSRAAETALQNRNSPLYAQMELYFSCMIRKKVRFYDQGEDTYVPASTQLMVGFRPVMTQRCSIHDSDGPPPLTDFPIARGDKFVPHWLAIDFRHGQWLGEFGY